MPARFLTALARVALASVYGALVALGDLESDEAELDVAALCVPLDEGEALCVLLDVAAVCVPLDEGEAGEAGSMEEPECLPVSGVGALDGIELAEGELEPVDDTLVEAAEELEAEEAVEEAQLRSERDAVDPPVRPAVLATTLSIPTAQPTALPTSVPTAIPTAVPACDPACPDFCIPPPPPDLDCGSFSDQRNFRVLAPDPHHLDHDGNGLACEADPTVVPSGHHDIDSDDDTDSDFDSYAHRDPYIDGRRGRYGHSNGDGSSHPGNRV